MGVPSAFRYVMVAIIAIGGGYLIFSTSKSPPTPTVPVIDTPLPAVDIKPRVKTLAIYCSDPRFHPVIYDWMKNTARTPL